MFNKLLDAGISLFISQNNDEWIVWTALQAVSLIATYFSL